MVSTRLNISPKIRIRTELLIFNYILLSELYIYIYFFILVQNFVPCETRIYSKKERFTRNYENERVYLQWRKAREM